MLALVVVVASGGGGGGPAVRGGAGRGDPMGLGEERDNDDDSLTKLLSWAADCCSVIVACGSPG